MKITFPKTFSLDPAQLRDNIAAGYIDAYQDHDNSMKSRKGLTVWATPSVNNIDGLYVDKNSNTVTVAGGIVYITTTAGATTACTGDALNIGNHCVFDEDANYIFIAHGGRIAKVDATAKTVSLIASASSPDYVTHLACIQSYLVSNGTGGISGDTYFTGPSTIAEYLDTWEIYNNEALADGLKAVAADGQFIYNFGSKSIELSTNDGITPWAKYGIAFIPYGVYAPHSIARADNRFFWLGVADNSLRILKMEGGSALAIGTPYDALINTLTVTDNAYGYVTGIDGHTFYVLQFPSEALTLVYHLQQDCWYQWGYYNTTTGQYDCFKGTCAAYNPALNKNLIGIGATTICELDGTTDNGDLIRTELTTGNISGGTYKQKRASRMRFQLSRGTTSGVIAEPVLTWQHRDDGGSWKPERQVSLGQRGHYNYLGQLDRCGVYRERQHRIVFTDPTCQLIIVDIEESNALAAD